MKAHEGAHRGAQGARGTRTGGRTFQGAQGARAPPVLQGRTAHRGAQGATCSPPVRPLVPRADEGARGAYGACTMPHMIERARLSARALHVVPAAYVNHYR